MKSPFLFLGLTFTGGLIARAVQSTYNSNIRPAVAGLRADMRPVTKVSGNVESAGGIGFGVPVAQGVRDGGVVPFGAAHVVTDFIGITELQRNTLPTDPDRYGQYESALVMQKGPIWAVAAVAVGAGDPVHVTTTGTLSNTGGIAIPNARWDTSTTGAGQLAVVFLG